MNILSSNTKHQTNCSERSKLIILHIPTCRSTFSSCTPLYYCIQHVQHWIAIFLLSNTLKKLAFTLRQSKTCSSDPAVPSPLGKKRQINASLSCRIGLFLTLNHSIFFSHSTELKYVFVSTGFGHLKHHTWTTMYLFAL